MTSRQQTPLDRDHVAKGEPVKDKPDSKSAPEAPDPAVDRPGFDLGGSTGKTTAGEGIGLGEDASEDPRGRSLPGRRTGGHPED